MLRPRARRDGPVGCGVVPTAASKTLLGAVIVGAAALRFPTLDTQSFWADEAVTVDLLSRSFGDMLGSIGDSESTPPLYYVVAWLWTQVCGTGEVGLRSLSALLGTALVPVAWALAGRIGGAGRAGRLGDRAAIFGALLVATNPLLVWFSQEARAYALLALLVALSLLALMRALETPSRGRLLAWGSIAALALATHYFALFFVIAEGLWLIWKRGPRSGALALVLPVLAAAALAPLATAQREADRAGFIREAPVGERIAQVPKQFLAGYDAPAETLVAVIAGVLVGAGLVALVLRRRWRARATDDPGALRAQDPRREPAAAVTAAAIAVSLLAPAFLAAVGSDYIIARNLLATLAPLLVLTAAGLALLPRWVGGSAAGLLALLWAAVVVAVAGDPALQRDDWRTAAASLGPVDPGGGRGVLVLPGSGRVPATLYLPRSEAVPRAQEAIEVMEISVVSVASQQGPEPRTAPGIRVDPPPLGFRLVARDRGETWSTVRFRAPAPVPVSNLVLSSNGGALLMQRR